MNEFEPVSTSGWSPSKAAPVGLIELEVSFKNYHPPQLLSYLPTVEQVDSHTIRYLGEDMVAISKFLTVTTGYQVSLSP